MTMHFRDLADKAAADGAITPDEILALRRQGWSDGRINPDEAEAIFAINDAIAMPDAEWSDFFVEAIGEFIINRVEPKGYVSEAQADWLIDRIDHDGHVQSMTELELLVRLFERALTVPHALREYALAQIEHAVLTGEGPTRCGGGLARGNLTDSEVRLMRRILFASGSERPAGISRKEAELLYRLKDATLGADNAPEWKQLFVQGVGNYLAGFTAYEALSRERAAELEAFMSDSRSSLGGFVARMGKSALRDSFIDTLGSVIRKKPQGPDRDAQAAEARAVDLAEQTWLEGRIDGNGIVDEFDEALLAFLAEESGFARGEG